MGIAIVTGASRGLGRGIAAGLASRGWSLVIDARGAEALKATEAELRPLMRPGARLVTIPGDVTNPKRRQALAGAAHALGGLDLLVSNAGILGPTPLPKLDAYPLAGLRDVIEVYVVAGLGLIQETITMLRAAPSGGRIVMVTSDASVEGYEGWGGYGAAKAAVDQLARVLAVEEPGLHVWAVDPGDLRTEMHQQAFPGEDISDRPEPETVVPAIIGLVESNRPSGRVRAAELVVKPVAP